MVTKEEALRLPYDSYPTIVLKDRLLNALKEVAHMRTEKEDEMSPTKFTEVERNHFIGLCGEAAVAGYYNIPMNLIYNHPIDPGYDFRVRHISSNNPITIDVKTRTKLDGDLLVSINNVTENVDIYILCIAYNEYVSLQGATSLSLLKEADTRTIDSDTVYHIPQSDLYSIPEREDITSVELEMEGLSAVNVSRENLISVKDTPV